LSCTAYSCVIDQVAQRTSIIAHAATEREREREREGEIKRERERARERYIGLAINLLLHAQ
jgi:hypothetical protein